MKHRLPGDDAGEADAKFGLSEYDDEISQPRHRIVHQNIICACMQNDAREMTSAVHAQ